MGATYFTSLSPPAPGRCAVGGCRQPIAGLFSWGVYPDGEHNRLVPLCPEHLDEVWTRIKGAVAAQACHFEAAMAGGRG